VAIIKEEEEDLDERIINNTKQHQDFEQEHIQKENCMPTSGNNNSQQEKIGENLSEGEIPREVEEEISCRSRENQSIIFLGNNDDDDNSLLSLKDFRSRTVPPPIMNMMNIEFQYLTIEGGGSKSSSVNDILYLVDCSQANCNTTQSIFLVDLARCEAQNLNYALLEKLKNGAWMSTKYEDKKLSIKMDKL
jgi:hypothetical protein